MSLGDISDLEELNLTINNLNENIPKQISKLSMLSYFNVSSRSANLEQVRSTGRNFGK